MADEIFDCTQASEYLQITEQTLRKLARENVIPARKVGRSWRFTKSSLKEWLESGSISKDEVLQEFESTYNQTVHILVIDDEVMIRECMNRLLTFENYKVSLAENGFEALEILKNNDDINLIFLDISMPKMNGFETLKRIRSQYGDIPVIILTAYSESSLVKLALDYSPITLLAKPCYNEKILEAISFFGLNTGALSKLKL